jgi:hypothetical protein
VLSAEKVAVIEPDRLAVNACQRQAPPLKNIHIAGKPTMQGPAEFTTI